MKLIRVIKKSKLMGLIHNICFLYVLLIHDGNLLICSIRQTFCWNFNCKFAWLIKQLWNVTLISYIREVKFNRSFTNCFKLLSELLLYLIFHEKKYRQKFIDWLNYCNLFFKTFKISDIAQRIFQLVSKW
jgi:hypothetical protein